MKQVVDKKIYRATEVKSTRPKKSSTVQINTSVNDVVFCKYPKDRYTPESEYDKYLPNLKITVRLPETTITNKDGKTIKKDARTEVFYMSPFRDYRMQISGSIDGDGDYASTEVIGFYNLINNLMAGGDRAILAPKVYRNKDFIVIPFGKLKDGKVYTSNKDNFEEIDSDVFEITSIASTMGCPSEH